MQKNRYPHNTDSNQLEFNIYKIPLQNCTQMHNYSSSPTTCRTCFACTKPHFRPYIEFFHACLGTAITFSKKLEDHEDYSFLYAPNNLTPNIRFLSLQSAQSLQHEKLLQNSCCQALNQIAVVITRLQVLHPLKISLRCPGFSCLLVQEGPVLCPCNLDIVQKKFAIRKKRRILGMERKPSQEKLN